MYRIKALNDVPNNEVASSNEDQLCTKEAEETIIVSEYMRALKYKKDDRSDDAFFLFGELLQTQLLDEITSKDKDNVLFSVKYNCYKNLGFISLAKEEKESALKYLSKACELDCTDVFTLNKLGHLASDMNRLSLAQNAFEQCLIQSPNYFPAIDGMLQLLCLKEDYTEAYGWALIWYEKYPDYERALNVILEIRELFNCDEDPETFIERCWKVKFKDTHLKRKSIVSMFPKPDVKDDFDPIPKPIFTYRITEQTWLSIGQFLLNVFEQYGTDMEPFCYSFKFDELFVFNGISEPDDTKETEIPLDDLADVEIIKDSDVDMKENSNSNNGQLDGISGTAGELSTEDSEPTHNRNGNENVSTDAKPKSRRRISDLSSLEQWGWFHKNKRYAQRKKSQLENGDDTTTIRGFLKRILSNYFKDNFDNDSSFTLGKSLSELNGRLDTENDKWEMDEISEMNFQKQNDEKLTIFLDKLKTRSFDMLYLLYEWLKQIASLWSTQIPDALQDLYLKVYMFYLNFYELHTWNTLDNKELQDVLEMCIFYLELFYDKKMAALKSNCESKVNHEWNMLFCHILFHTGFMVECTNYDTMLQRLCWLQYGRAKYEQNYDTALNCILRMEDICISDNNEFKLLFPNQRYNNRVDKDVLITLKIAIERTLSLNTVLDLYSKKDFKQLANVLIKTLESVQSTDVNVLQPSNQMEILLESFWMLGNFRECLIWCERCLDYATRQFLISSTGARLYHKNIAFICSYIETIITEEPDLFDSLERYSSRLVQNIAKILSSQLDTPYDKNRTDPFPIDTKLPFIILYRIAHRSEILNPIQITPVDADNPDISEETMPNSLMIFFMAHEFLGKRCGCTKDDGIFLLYMLDHITVIFRAPYLDPYRDIIKEYVEQITYCLYRYPAKRARARHIEEHDAQKIDLTWDRAIKLFDLYRPDNPPEFNSYKNDSISSDMEQILQQILALMPTEIDPKDRVQDIKKFISGDLSEVPQIETKLPYRVSCIYYLLADYYFKSRDFIKSIEYYQLDLIIQPDRFDSWAGLALSKASLLESKINSCNLHSPDELLVQSDEVICCFEQCLKLNDKQIPLWIEYGNFAYTLHSFCSRNLKLSSATLSIEKFEFIEHKKEELLKIASDCFKTVEQMTKQHMTKDGNSDDSHDEKWLYHYMLGKIAEKRKMEPNLYLNHYITAAKCLYEHNATYPFKINHSTPQNLSVEALEVFYRTTASIVKYIEQHAEIPRTTGKLFIKILKEIAISPFALNQAKIDDASINALKRKSLGNGIENPTKISKVDDSCIILSDNEETGNKNAEKIDESVIVVENMEENPVEQSEEIPKLTVQETAPNRRKSQESAVSAPTTVTESSSSSFESSSDDSETSDSESSSDGPNHKKPVKIVSNDDVKCIYQLCIKNLEECVTRFPEHYKSIYRLINIFLNAPHNLRDTNKCKQLLLGTYKTLLGTDVQGLFADRKSNNFFNGIWRIPSTEIDRPGSFAAHLSKCVIILIDVLSATTDHAVLLELSITLQKTPENDKRYIKEAERKELFQLATTFYSKTFRDMARKYDGEQLERQNLLSIMIEIFKAYKQCSKQTQTKDNAFAIMLVDAYKIYYQENSDRENVNLLDRAIKLCQSGITIKKNIEKSGLQYSPSLDYLPKFTDSSLTVHTIPKTTTVTVVTTGTTTPSLVPFNQYPSPSISNFMPTTSVSLVVPSSYSKSTVTPTISESISSTTNQSRPRGRPVGSTKHSNLMGNVTNTFGSSDALSKALSNYTNSFNYNTTKSSNILDHNLLPSLSQLPDPVISMNTLTEYYKLLATMTSMAGPLTPQVGFSSFDSKNAIGSSNARALPSSSSLSSSLGNIKHNISKDLTITSSKLPPTTETISSTVAKNSQSFMSSFQSFVMGTNSSKEMSGKRNIQIDSQSAKPGNISKSSAHVGDSKKGNKPKRRKLMPTLDYGQFGFSNYGMEYNNNTLNLMKQYATQLSLGSSVKSMDPLTFLGQTSVLNPAYIKANMKHLSQANSIPTGLNDYFQRPSSVPIPIRIPSTSPNIGTSMNSVAAENSKPKSLQQKLAERQKELSRQQSNSNLNTTTNKDDDVVIVLE